MTPAATHLTDSVAPVTGPRVGVDLVSVSDVAASLARFGDRYEARIFTERELADAAGPPATKAEMLAARFAAKEAVIKVLSPTGPAPPWRSVELERAPGGACAVRLHGEARRLASEGCLAGWSVSMCHEAGMAVAVVAAMEVPLP
jgi:holo-[acyl-carrier protein] synthase